MTYVMFVIVCWLINLLKLKLRASYESAMRFPPFSHGFHVIAVWQIFYVIFDPDSVSSPRSRKS